ncbi:hypothetical protein WA026_021886 [Henosepilachna vigintioctopunctata]|uniref:Uncharacterized protein n=1 Tax=Henosepilachna vigintioctopunctata TaxID=420089 RepID=A0AAW1USN1_9CUCU
MNHEASDPLTIPVSSFPNEISNEISLTSNMECENLLEKSIVEKSNKNPSSNNKKVKSDNSLRYQLYDVGPYLVHIDSVDPNIKNLSQMIVGKLIFRNDKKIAENVINIKKSVIKRVVLEMRTFISVNLPISSNLLKDNKLEAHVYLFLLRRLIKRIDLDKGIDELKSSISPIRREVCNITKAKRLNRRVVNEDKSVQHVPTLSVLLTFRGQC